ncbi:MAG: tetratricopeptide repeat-containing sulfotransferase family protein [Rhizomicrobium sp.]|jgi:tetratricopeptide (TPR) repeat protein
MDTHVREPAGPLTTQDAFAAAAERLSAARPLSDRRLQEIEAAISEGRLTFAEEELARYLNLHPADADAIFLMARTQLRLGRQAQSIILLKRCVELTPHFIAARYNYADLLLRAKDFPSAMDEIARLLATDPRNPLFRQLQANVLRSVGEGARSVDILGQLAAEYPERFESWLNYGHGLRALGQRDGSIAAYRRAIELQPSSGKAYWALANLKMVRLSDADIEAIEQQLKRTDLAPDDRVQLQYALGKAYEDKGAYGRSFEQYARGNAAMRLRIPYDPAGVSRHVAASKALFTPQFLMSRKGAGSKAPDPIFIVSLPRSGSTLTEQILSSHSAIEGAEELPYITLLAKRLETQGYPATLDNVDIAAFQEFGEEYLRVASAHRKLGRQFFVDKKPPNWFHLGLIHLILPNAKIIDARRHPVACCFSQFRQYFHKPRPRQAELGRLYRDYVELMAHFDRILPGKVHRVFYEELVANPETEIRKLLEYLDLPFEEKCLYFHETKRSILTPSSEQVRSPLFTEAVAQWRNYEPWLGPLIDSLGSVLTEYPSVPEELR